MYSRVVDLTLEAKLVLSKHLIQVLLEILSRSVENILVDEVYYLK